MTEPFLAVSPLCMYHGTSHRRRQVFKLPSPLKCADSASHTPSKVE